MIMKQLSESQDRFLGPILFLIVYHLPSIFPLYKLLKIGYDSGEKFISKAFKSGLFELITNCATIVGLIMVRAMTASFVTIKTGLKWKVAGTTLKLQNILNSIMPGLLPLILTLTILVLLRKKVKVIYLLLGVIILGILGALVGIF